MREVPEALRHAATPAACNHNNPVSQGSVSRSGLHYREVLDGPAERALSYLRSSELIGTDIRCVSGREHALR